jgi:hypothetical protein
MTTAILFALICNCSMPSAMPRQDCWPPTSTRWKLPYLGSALVLIFAWLPPKAATPAV